MVISFTLVFSTNLRVFVSGTVTYYLTHRGFSWYFNIVRAPKINSNIENILGSNGKDTIEGNSGMNSIISGSGDDTITISNNLYFIIYSKTKKVI